MATPVARAASPAPADSTAPMDSSRIVRQFEPVVVEGGRRSDPGSLETAYPIPASTLRALPVDRLVDAIALQAGVVAVGEDLHVRGGRAGELAVTAVGVSLNDPLWGRAMEVPLMAVKTSELLVGTLDADHRGALAGELDLQTETPTRTPSFMARWVSDGRESGSYDAVLARLAGPLGVQGLGLALAGEARLDDLGLPSTRTVDVHDWLGAQLHWRQDNHLLGWAKLAPIERPQRGSLEVFGSRILREPYHPMFTFDGWVTPTGAVDDSFPYRLSDEPLDSTSLRYRAADHVVMTDERRVAVIATKSFENAGRPLRITLGWLRSTSLTSVDLRRDLEYTLDGNHPVWGPYNRPDVDPFHAYLGDEPFFRRSDAQRWLFRSELSAAPGHGQRLKVGVGVTYDDVQFTELDDAPEVLRVDTLRTFQAFAPGGFAYGQHRWEVGGLIWNAGLRLQVFTAGPQASASDPLWTWSPRLGFAYPISVRDAFSVSYARIHQEPERVLLYENRAVGYNTHPLGNDALTPAEMISYQAAVKHILDPRWSLQIGVFYRDVYGQPGARNVPTPRNLFGLEYQSADHGHAQGVELTLRATSSGGQQAQLSYTFMDAYGTQSSPNGLAFGRPVGARPTPLGTHPLDWDQRHLITFAAQLHTASEWTLAWSTRVGSGLPWTPLVGSPGFSVPPYVDQSEVNSRRLPWNESTDLSVRWAAKFLFGARAILAVTNLFDNRAPQSVTINGHPNPIINTIEDDYTAFHTETGLGGGAYFDNGPAIGSPGWIRVFDRRLDTRVRSVRFGIEIGR